MNTTDTKLQNDILDILAGGGTYGARFFAVDGGAPFEAVTQSDLMEALRERGWRGLGYLGNLNDTARELGFKVKQAQHFGGKVRRVYRDGRTGRTLSDYQTIIFI